MGYFILIIFVLGLLIWASKGKIKKNEEKASYEKVIDETYMVQNVSYKPFMKDISEDTILKTKYIKEDLTGILTQSNELIGHVSSNCLYKIPDLRNKGYQVLISAKNPTVKNFSIQVEVYNELWNPTVPIDNLLNEIKTEKENTQINQDDSVYAKEFGKADFMEMKSTKFDSKYLKPQKDLPDNGNYFYKKKVVITGGFEAFPFREKLAKKLWELGADIDTTIGKNTDVTLVGSYNIGPKKMEKILSQNIKIIREEELLELLEK